MVQKIVPQPKDTTQLADHKLATEAERRRKIAEQMENNDNASKEKQTVQKIEPSAKDNTQLADHKLATAFNTNRTY